MVDLLTNATAAGARVEGTRVDPNRKTQLPAIGVYTLSETVNAELSANTSPRELTREPKVMIECAVRGTDAVPVDDAMDDIAEQVEAAMDADRYLGGNVAESTLESTEMAVERNDPRAGFITLTYAVTYRTTPAVGTLDDFLRSKATHQIVGGIPGDTIPAADGPFVVQEAP